MRWLDRLLLRAQSIARGSALVERVVLLSRVSLGLGFIAPAMIKARGLRFTSLSTEDPVGAFFEAMYQTGFYWRFIGFSQLGASLLLLLPRTTTMGACLFTAIMVNIFVITVSVGFTGTPFITGLMLLACVLLLLWDYHRLRPMLGFGREGETLAPQRRSTIRWFEVLGAVMAIPLCFFILVYTRQVFPSIRGWWVVGLAAGDWAIGCALLFARILPWWNPLWPGRGGGWNGVGRALGEGGE